MNFSKWIKRASVAFALFSGLILIIPTANASLVWSNDNSILLGINGITVAGQTYNVTFQDGTVGDVYGGSGSIVLPFQNATDSFDAAVLIVKALNEAMFYDPLHVYGMGYTQGAILVPISYNGNVTSYAALMAQGFPSGVSAGLSIFGPTVSTAYSLYYVWSEWSSVAPSSVPLPPTALLMASALGLLGLFHRNRKAS